MINITEIKQQVLDFVKAFVKKVHGQDQAQKITRQSFIDKIKQAGFDINPSSFRTFFAKLEKIADADNIESAVFNNSKYIKALVMQQIIIAICPALQYVLSGNPIEFDPKKILGLEDKPVSATNEESEEVDERRGRKRKLTFYEAGKLFQSYFSLLRIANILKHITRFKKRIQAREIKEGAAISFYNNCHAFIDDALKGVKDNGNIKNKVLIIDSLQKAKTTLSDNQSALLALNRPLIKGVASSESGNYAEVESLENQDKRAELYLRPLWAIYAMEIYIAVCIILLVVDFYGIFSRSKVEIAYNRYLQFKLQFFDTDQKEIGQTLNSLRRHGNMFFQKEIFNYLKILPQKHDGSLNNIEGYLNTVNVELTCSFDKVIRWFCYAINQSFVYFDKDGNFYQDIAVGKEFYKGLQIIDITLCNAIMRIEQSLIPQNEFISGNKSDAIDIIIPKFNLGVDELDSFSLNYYDALYESLDVVNNSNSVVPAQSQVLDVPDAEPVSAEVFEPSMAEETLPDKQTFADPPTVEETGSQEITDLPNTDEAVSGTELQEQSEAVDPVQSYNEEEDVPAPVYTQPDMSSQSAEETPDTEESPIQEEPQPQVASNPFMQPVYLDMMGFNYMPNQNPAYDEYMRAMSNYGSVDGYIPDEPSQDIPAGGGYIPR